MVSFLFILNKRFIYIINSLSFLEFIIFVLGQALGLVIADSQRHANEAAKLALSNYTNIKTPILTVQVL